MRNLCICLALLYFHNIAPAIAAQVTGQLANGIWVNAEYHAAEDSKPTILLIHPFQQTNRFSTIINLADSLADSGYGVLAPNLSLGISNRRQSMACEAIHMQGLMQDIEEASFWINWLAEKVDSRVIGMGHSTGALQILGYPNTEKLSSMVLISLVAIGAEGAAKIDTDQLVQARQARDKGLPDGLGHFKFSYCQNYVSSRHAYLDTAEWDAEKVSRQLQSLNIKTDIILGDEDYRREQPWLVSIRNPDISLHLIKNANHFFSGIEEFDLHDKVLEILDSAE